MQFLPKPARLRLNREQYDQLRHQILQRDGWSCQYCGRRENLEIHHMQRRSQLGPDCENNLIALCWRCHWQVHVAEKRRG
jgi:5-methylcytosine-specific restriction endonuclease McrA